MNEISLMYSGGLDTTYTAMRLLEEHDRVHLLTFDSGVMHWVREFSTKNPAALRKSFGADRIVHSIISTRELIRLQASEIGEGMKRYHTPGVVCTSCQFAMEVMTVAYCLEHGIPFATDGKSKAQTEVCLQTVQYCREIQRFMALFGIDYRMPLAHGISRNEKRRFLRERGFFHGVPALTLLQKLGFNNFSDFLGRQPICRNAVFPFFLTSHLRHIPPFKSYVLKIEDAEDYRKRIEPLATRFLEERFRGQGGSLEQRVKDLSALRQPA